VPEQDAGAGGEAWQRQVPAAAAARGSSLACPLSCRLAVDISGVRSSTNAYRPSVCTLQLTTGSSPGAHLSGKAAMSAVLNSWRSMSLVTMPCARLPT
jgi:hypothetical protein